MKGKATGLGGVFIKFKDPDNMKKWYSDVLGLVTNDYGVLFSFNNGQLHKAYLQLGTFPAETVYFGSKEQQLMLNFRIDDLTAFLDRIKNMNVPVLDQIETYEYGKFIHISDPEGNRIELWEPVDESFSDERDSSMS